MIPQRWGKYFTLQTCGITFKGAGKTGHPREEKENETLLEMQKVKIKSVEYEEALENTAKTSLDNSKHFVGHMETYYIV